MKKPNYVKLLMAVKEQMLTGLGSPYICDNLTTVSQRLDMLDEAYDLRRLIARRLDGNFDLSRWLLVNGHISVVVHDNWEHDPGLREKMQRTRMNWLDALIKEFSCKDARWLL